MSSVFNRWTDADVLELIEAYPLAIMVSFGPQGFASTPLPMLADVDANGRLVRLLGHMSRANLQVSYLQAQPAACFLFQGPQAYVSPRLLSNRNWAPTWNYALVQVHAEVEFMPELNDQALRCLVTRMESGHQDPWTIEELGDRYEELSRHITAFIAEVRSVEARFKLGQNEKRTNFEQILAGLEEPELVQWMKKFAQQRDGS